MNKYLIVVDMQNDFTYGSLGSQEALAIIPAVVEKCKSYDPTKIIFTQDTHYFGYLNTLEGQKLPVEHCIFQTKGWEIISELQPYVEDDFLNTALKETFGWNRWSELFEDYADDPNFEIEIVGVCTDICVVSNVLALRAAFPDTKITVDASCCAGTSITNHIMALQVMKSCQIDVVNDNYNWKLTV